MSGGERGLAWPGSVRAVTRLVSLAVLLALLLAGALAGVMWVLTAFLHHAATA